MRRGEVWRLREGKGQGIDGWEVGKVREGEVGQARGWEVRVRTCKDRRGSKWMDTREVKTSKRGEVGREKGGPGNSGIVGWRGEVRDSRESKSGRESEKGNEGMGS